MKLRSIDGGTFTSDGALKIEDGNVELKGIKFIPTSITAASLDVDNFFQQGQPLELLGDMELVVNMYIGNTKNITIAGNPYIPSSITLQSGRYNSGTFDYGRLTGDIETSGDIKIIANDFIIDLTANITADNAIFCRRSSENVNIGDSEHITPAELARFTLSDSYIFGDHGSNTATAVNFYDNFTTASSINAKADTVYVATGATVKSTGANTTVSLTDGNINFDAATIEAPNVIIDPFNGVTYYYLDIDGTTINASNHLINNKVQRSCKIRNEKQKGALHVQSSIKGRKRSNILLECTGPISSRDRPPLKQT